MIAYLSSQGSRYNNTDCDRHILGWDIKLHETMGGYNLEASTSVLVEMVELLR